jgi:hypothetical protein
MSSLSVDYVYPRMLALGDYPNPHEAIHNFAVQYSCFSMHFTEYLENAMTFLSDEDRHELKTWKRRQVVTGPPMQSKK